MARKPMVRHSTLSIQSRAWRLYCPRNLTSNTPTKKRYTPMRQSAPEKQEMGPFREKIHLAASGTHCSQTLNLSLKCTPRKITSNPLYVTWLCAGAWPSGWLRSHRVNIRLESAAMTFLKASSFFGFLFLLKQTPTGRAAVQNESWIAERREPGEWTKNDGREETDREDESERGQGIQVMKVWSRADTRELKRRKRSDITKRSEYKAGGSKRCMMREGSVEGISIPVTIFSFLKFLPLMLLRKRPRATSNFWNLTFLIAGYSEIDFVNILIWLKADYKFSFLKKSLHKEYFMIISLSQDSDEEEVCLTFLCIQSTTLAWRYFHLSKGRLSNFVWYNLQSLSVVCGSLAFRHHCFWCWFLLPLQLNDHIFC